MQQLRPLLAVRFAECMRKMLRFRTICVCYSLLYNAPATRWNENTFHSPREGSENLRRNPVTQLLPIPVLLTRSIALFVKTRLTNFANNGRLQLVQFHCATSPRTHFKLLFATVALDAQFSARQRIAHPSRPHAEALHFSFQ